MLWRITLDLAFRVAAVTGQGKRTGGVAGLFVSIRGALRVTILYLRRSWVSGPGVGPAPATASRMKSTRTSRLPSLQRTMEAMWPTKKTPQPEHHELNEDDEKTKDECDVERCLKLVMMDFDSSSHGSLENMKTEQENRALCKIDSEKPKPTKKAAGKHNQKKCAKCMKLYYVVNILVEGCLMALVRQSLEHVDLLITKMELKGVTDRAVFQQYLQHGLTLSDKVDSFYQRQDRMYNAFKVCARMRHSKTAQDLIKQGFELLNEMRELNNKYQVSIDNFCNLMAESAGVEVN